MVSEELRAGLCCGASLALRRDFTAKRLRKSLASIACAQHSAAGGVDQLVAESMSQRRISTGGSALNL
jgi:hypothetical protein